MSTFARVSASVLLVLALPACRSGQSQLAAPVSPASHTEWVAALLQSSQEAGASRYAAADKLLADFSIRFPAAPEAADALYWRALYKLDPANTSAGPRDAAVLLDSYLGSASPAHRSEAVALRRIATALESRSVPAAAPGRSEPVPVAPDKARDDEIQRLKEELAKANAELERIKRRLAQPKP